MSPACRPRPPVPHFSTLRSKDATAVARLRAAGALMLGKTNLDQFATGLVGVRTPYGVGRNLFDAKLIPGGSSTGSALAVGAGIVPLSLGTDTAGSGRVPAAYSNIVGLKPSLGLVSTAGVVPACRTLDCVSVFALTVDDAMTALKAIAGPTRPIRIRGRARWARSAPCRTVSNLACRRPASGCSSAIRFRPPHTMRLGQAFRSRRRDCRGRIWSRSMKRRGSSTTARGSPNAISLLRT